MKKAILSVAVMMAALSMQAADADYHVVPLPQSITAMKGQPFVLSNATVIVAEGDADMQRNGRFLSEFVHEATGLQLQVATGKVKAKTGRIVLRLNSKLTAKEGYQITVDSKNVVVEGLTPAGVFYGVQTLRKSLPVGTTDTTISLPAAKIADSPRFDYRGGMLDCCRHYFSVNFVKQFIDMLALHNLNTFHWHLTEDQGWRMEVTKHPKLTQLGARREQTVIGKNSGVFDGTPYGEGLYYTVAQMRDIVDYAAKRHITVIPEIDMPGHMLGALKAYPELGCTGGPYKVAEQWGVFDDILCAGKEETFKFIEDVMDEVCDIFPGKTIHLGGDEAPRTRWKSCPLCQQRIKELGIKAKPGVTPEAQLQVYFLNRVARYLKAKGRNVIGWDEILEGDDIDPATTVMSWRGTEGGKVAAERGLNAVMSPVGYHYFDYYQTKNHDIQLIGSYLPASKTYSYDPVPADAPESMKKHIIGVQANLWTEYIGSEPLAEYQLLPRLAAMAETGWTDNSKKNFDEFKVRESKLAGIYDLKGWTYCKEMWQGEK